MRKILNELSECGNCKHFIELHFEHNERVLRLEGCKYFIKIKTAFSYEERYRDYLRNCEFWEACSDNKAKRNAQEKEALDVILKTLEQIVELNKNGDIQV